MNTKRRHVHLQQSLVRWVILVVVGIYLLLPLFAMLEFSTRAPGGGRSLTAWASIGTNSDLISSIIISLELAALTVAAMLLMVLPTITWVHLRLPRLRRTIEFLCILPLTIPAMVIVVGIAPIYVWVTYILGNSPLTLVFIFLVLALPYVHRTIDAGLKAVDVITLAEAARSMGASWPRVLVQIVFPNIRGAIISASVISISLVLGEFTIASLLNFNTLQVVINLIGKSNASVAVAVSFTALVFVFVLLLGLASIAAKRSRFAIEEATVKGETL